MMLKTMAPRAAAAVLLAGSLVACGDSPTDPGVSKEQQKDLDALRRVTASYTSFSSAQAAGYSEQLTGCMSDASGGMGFHYGKTSLIDGEVKVTEPEILLYEPQPDGSLQFVAVEYVVPFTASATAPELFGLQFHRNEAFQLWVLHAWVYRDNPSGIFSDWNPTVTCAAAK